ncbi:NDR1/HIN1-like protein 1 [Phoenix dactylifera]|uniref:NDR1/HIN1-like protein 1 n=1 Tax=Phoenix dactylifera TaxID=42345 RepID=A0A8B7BFU7_PHODC|nr:NDR1/HIN1-like protein 1 [Phoenix dactylifera]WCF34212.1 late embryonic abundant protein 2.7 [Phoenix dactylifera]
MPQGTTKRSTAMSPSAANPARLLCSAILVFILLAGITALILYLVYRPSRPHFSVLSTAIYQLGNGTASAAVPATAITTTMQFTVLIRNTNERASIRYDRLSAYVTYHDQAITAPAPLPPLYQERDSAVAVSPVLGGGPVPVSGDIAAGLMTDEAYGVVALRLVMLGRLRYKSGPFHSAWYGMYVRCDMLLGAKKGVSGQVPLLGTPDCDVDI